MGINEILSEAEILIASGKKDFLQIEKKTKYYRDSEYYIIYSRAVNLVLEAYCEETEIRIDQFFATKIPKLFDNRECENVLEEFQNLKNSEVTVRIKASKFFRQKALNETNGFRSILFKRPDTFAKLVTALKTEEDEKVIINLIIALGGAYERYFNHFRVFDNIAPFFYHKKSEVRYYAIIWTRSIEHNEKKEILNSLYQQKQSKKVTKLLEKYMNEIEN